jgi:hypothetical protein
MQSSTCWVWGFVAQILQPEPLPFTLERLHSSLQRRKIDLANRQSGSKVRAQEQTAANLNRVHPAEIERNAGVALERVLHGRNNRRSVHTASSTFLLKAAEGSRPLWREVWWGWGEGGARGTKRHFPTAQQLHARNKMRRFVTEILFVLICKLSVVYFRHAHTAPGTC